MGKNKEMCGRSERLYTQVQSCGIEKMNIKIERARVYAQRTEHGEKTKKAKE